MVKITKGKKNIWVTFVVECDGEPVVKGNWDEWVPHPMKKRKDGKYSYKKVLKPGAYEFGYLCADKWIIEDELPSKPNPYGGENSILII